MQLLFADQLGPHFDLGGEILLPEVLGQFRKRPYHRQKAHLILYALRARAQDARVRTVSIESYRDLLDDHPKLEYAVHPTSREQLALAKALGLEVLPARGFASTFEQWEKFSRGKRSTKLEDFYRGQRRRHQLLMHGEEPISGRWNFDEENRQPPPRGGLGIPGPWHPQEDALDREVRATLDELAKSGVRFMGADGPRKFAATREQALAALEHFINFRLDLFGPYEDAVDKGDWAMAHSLLSVPMNLGLLDPLEVAKAAEQAFHEGKARLSSVEGFIRQIVGWRDYVWHLYWHFGPDYEDQNFLDANEQLPIALAQLAPSEIESNCLSSTVFDVSTNGWAHHIQRLMILGNFAAQRGWNPKLLNDWFVDAFVDGTPWVMPANVIGMSQFADGGKMSTKPYVSGGAYISKMTNYCGSCRFDPKKRVGPDACPLTAGYWNYLSRNKDKLSTNFRMRNGYAGLSRLVDLDQVVEQESSRKTL